MAGTISVTFAILSLTVAAHALPRGRSVGHVIVGGQDATKNELPYQISLQLYSNHWCGGSIISDSYILTAAHCLQDGQVSAYLIVAGEHSLSRNDGTEQKRAIKRMILHEEYRGVTTGDDVALLELTEPLEFNDAVQPIALPPKGHLPAGTALISGWGALKPGGNGPDVLQKVEVPLISDDQCQAKYRPRYTIRESMVCAGLAVGGKDSCQGDSGGPLVAFDLETRYIAGIVSWGIGCADADYPGVYTEVSYFIDWIKRKMDA